LEYCRSELSIDVPSNNSAAVTRNLKMGDKRLMTNVSRTS
jgi:hypothetical protein